MAKRRKKLIPRDQFGSLIWHELRAYDDANRVIKETLERCVKNYRGIFDTPQTKYTKRDKTWVHLTKWHCDSIAAKIKVDAAAIEVLPSNEGDIGKAVFMNKVVQWQLRNLEFNELLSLIALDLTVLGTSVIATSWNTNPNLRWETILLERIDPLDIFCDPTTDSLQACPSVIVRSVKDLAWIRNNPNFKNTEQVQGISSITTRYSEFHDSTRLIPYHTGGYEPKANAATEGVFQIDYNQSKKVVIFERWGSDPESGEEFVTTVADIDNASPGVVLRHEANPFKNKKRPFIECWYRKVAGRWAGEGVSERLIPYQSWYNRNVNQRIDNAEALQNQMYKARRSAGIDPRQLISRPAGVILMDDIRNDLEALQTPDIRQSSFREEEGIHFLSQRITGGFDVAIGAPTQASKTLGANVLEQRGATDLFEFSKIYIRSFLKRLVEQIVDLNIQFLDERQIIPITGDDDEIRQIDEMNQIPSEIGKLLGRRRFLRLDKPSLIKGQFDIYVDVEGAVGQDRNLRMQQAMQLLQLSAQDQQSPINRQALYQDIILLMGKDPSRYFNEPTPQSPFATGAVPGMPQAAAIPQVRIPTQAAGRAPQLQNLANLS